MTGLRGENILSFSTAWSTAKAHTFFPESLPVYHPCALFPVPLRCVRSAYDAAKERWSGMLTSRARRGTGHLQRVRLGPVPAAHQPGQAVSCYLEMTGGRQERLWPPDCGSSPMAGGRPSGEGSIQASPGRASGHAARWARLTKPIQTSRRSVALALGLGGTPGDLQKPAAAGRRNFPPGGGCRSPRRRSAAALGRPSVAVDLAQAARPRPLERLVPVA